MSSRVSIRIKIKRALTQLNGGRKFGERIEKVVVVTIHIEALDS